MDEWKGRWAYGEIEERQRDRGGGGKESNGWMYEWIDAQTERGRGEERNS